MHTIRKVAIHNFEKLKSLTLDFEPGKNVLIGNDETGKSSILLAIDLAFAGSRNRIETLGIDTPLNKGAVDGFLTSDKTLVKLPKLTVVVSLEEGDDESFYGENNAPNVNTDGLRMVIAPKEEYGDAIKVVLAQVDANFPFEYYSVQHELR